MSFLEMSAASLPDMSSGIISLWFRDLSEGDPPDADEWPSGPWVSGGLSMVPPDTVELVRRLDAAVFYWNAYGVPTTGTGGELFYGNELVIMPAPPPLAVSRQRMLLTFGATDQSYDYCPWKLEYPAVTNPVIFVPNFGIIYNVTDFPPPYKPYFHEKDGKPVGKDGKFTVANMRLGSPANRPDMVPQSFIGIDPNGYLTVCLQTRTKADYRGYAFQLDRIEEIMAIQTIFEGAPPEPRAVPGKYWDGFMFHYKDISNEIMAAQPEAFVLGSAPAGISDIPGPPRVNDKTWHHLLLSFDIRGEVTSVQSQADAPPTTRTTCKAWLALDDTNYTDTALQHTILLPDGLHAPQLPGMGTNGIFPFGPSASYHREDLGLGPNEIVPQNVWICGFWGHPRDGLPRFESAAGFAPGNPYVAEGDFNWLVYTGVEWLLAGMPAAGMGRIIPPRPTNPDPAKDLDVPSYSGSGFVIPVNGHPIGVPASAHHLKHNGGLEMAELQIWANKTLDTADVINRRLFVTGDGKPQAVSKAEAVLGVPDIRLTGAADWKAGKNTGKAGQNFVPVAGIESFRPEPEIGA